MCAVLVAGVIIGASDALAGDTSTNRSKNVKIPVCDFTYQMERKGYTLKDSDYWNWSFHVVKGDDGKWHGFGERANETDIPFSGKFHCIASAHGTLCEIAHYIADKPEGPYKFVGVALPRGKQSTFDQSRIYPCIQRDGKRWVMMYSGVGSQHFMRSCMAVADSLNGPWRNLGVVIEPSADPKHGTYQSQIGNHVSQMLKFRDKWYAYFKAGKGLPGYLDYVFVAVADHPEGPWKIEEKPAIQKNGGGHPDAYIEDQCVFVWNDRVYMFITDNGGGVSGVPGGILLFESQDGLTFPFEKVRLAVDRIPAYCPDFDAKRAKVVWGGLKNINSSPLRCCWWMASRRISLAVAARMSKVSRNRQITVCGLRTGRHESFRFAPGHLAWPGLECLAIEVDQMKGIHIMKKVNVIAVALLFAAAFTALTLLHAATAEPVVPQRTNQMHDGRTTISMNGTWQITESVASNDIPTAFDHTVVVPGLVNLSKPAFPDVDFFASREYPRCAALDSGRSFAVRRREQHERRQRPDAVWHAGI